MTAKSSKASGEKKTCKLNHQLKMEEIYIPVYIYFSYQYQCTKINHKDKFSASNLGPETEICVWFILQ